MTDNITDHIRDTYNGKKPEYLVIYFHGYGSNGDLMEQYVGDLLGPMLPEAKMRFPDAPIVIGADDKGRQYRSWFDVEEWVRHDKAPDRDIVAERAAAAAKTMNEYVDRVIREEGISRDRVILAGFSQGGTMAFYTGLLRDAPVAGVYALSGGAMDKLQNPVSKPPVGLVAGAEEIGGDYSGPPQVELASAELKKMDFFLDTFIIPNQRHETSPKAMELLSVFARTVTSDAFKAKVAAVAPSQSRPQPPAPKRPQAP